MPRGFGLVETDIGGLDQNRAAVRHRITGVYDQVHDHLLDLARVGAHCSEIRGECRAQIDVLGDEAPKHLERFGDDVVDGDQPRLQHLFSAEGEQLTR